MRWLGIAALVLLGGCHTDPACAPGQGTIAEAVCTKNVLVECHSVPDSEYDECISKGDYECDKQAEAAVARCGQ